MVRSNLFANIENRFQFLNEEEIIEKTQQAFNSFIKEYAIQIGDTRTCFLNLTGAAKIGVASKNGTLNLKEKALADATFGQMWNKDQMENIYSIISDEIVEENYNAVNIITQLGNEMAFSFLYIVLGFAYIDGEVDEQVMNKLDGLFADTLLSLFMQSDSQNVPTPQIKLDGLEAEIYKWFKLEDKLRPLDEIVAHFPNYSKSEIKSALDSLCVKGIFYGGEKIIGCAYGLA